jgi:hypothetical protein
MSAIAESLRRQRLPLLTIALLLAATTGIWVFLAQTAADHRGSTDLPVAAPAIDQAPWKYEYSAEGRFGKLSKAQRESYANQKENVAALITGIYNGIFLEPARMEEVIKTSFSNEAARSLETKGLSFPDGATEVKTTRRRAHIALDAQKASFAVGRVTVYADATVGKRTIEIEHRSTLWLERADGDWKVIAFDVEQGPAR